MSSPTQMAMRCLTKEEAVKALALAFPDLLFATGDDEETLISPHYGINGTGDYISSNMLAVRNHLADDAHGDSQFTDYVIYLPDHTAQPELLDMISFPPGDQDIDAMAQKLWVKMLPILVKPDETKIYDPFNL